MASKLPVKFEPAQLRPRHGGWTAERQIAFIEALAETACVEEACRAGGALDSRAYPRARTRRPVAFAAFRRQRHSATSPSLRTSRTLAAPRAHPAPMIPITASKG